MMFENIPHIFYIDSGNSEYTEKNLENLGISNFTKVKKFEISKELVYNNCEITEELVSSILYIHTIKNWLESTTDDNMIIMSDHVDYSYVEYFHEGWDWDYLMDNLPHDWDSILLGFEDKLGVLPCFLHPMRDSHGTGMTLLNRKYAQKLVKFHYIDGKYNFFQKISNTFWKNDSGLVSPHYFMNQCGRSYAIPMFPRNPDLFQDDHFSSELIETNKKLYFLWWTKVRDKISVDQFHLYFSPKDVYLNLKHLNRNSNINKSYLKEYDV